MKRIVFILAFMILCKISVGQDTTKRFEFGSTLTTVDMYDLSYRPPTFQFVNGLFFQYSKKRFGLRFHASYSDNTTSNTHTSFEAPYFWGQTINNKDLKLGIGGQFSILNRKNWLYTFLDVSYRNVFSTGYRFGIWQEEFSSTSNGFDCFAGVGFKIRVINNFYLSPEIGYYSSSQFVNKMTTSADVYNVSTGQRVTRQGSYSVTDINPVLKLHLTVKF